MPVMRCPPASLRASFVPRLAARPTGTALRPRAARRFWPAARTPSLSTARLPLAKLLLDDALSSGMMQPSRPSHANMPSRPALFRIFGCGEGASS